jgi:hypothetical protein
MNVKTRKRISFYFAAGALGGWFATLLYGVYLLGFYRAIERFRMHWPEFWYEGTVAPDRVPFYFFSILAWFFTVAFFAYRLGRS